jgi:four helix bundle protein
MAYNQIEDLRILKVAEEIADRIWEMALKWPPMAKETIGKQLVRSVDSIGANIAEGYGRYHKNDIIRFLFISRGSLQETKYWLTRADRRKLITNDQFAGLMNGLNNLAPQLNAFISAKRRLDQ